MSKEVFRKHGISKKYRSRRINLQFVRKLRHRPAKAFWDHPMLTSLQSSTFEVPSLIDLLEGGMDPNLAPLGRSFLQWAVLEENIEKITMLVFCGAEVDEEAFQAAVAAGNIAIVLFLMRRRKRIRVSDADRIFADLIYSRSNVGKRLDEEAQAEVFLEFVRRFPKVFRAQLPFLSDFINECDFSASNWLKCLHGLFGLPNAAAIVENEPYQDLHDMLGVFLEKSIPRPDRMDVLRSWLGLGGEVNSMNLNFAIYFWGMSEEVDAMIHSLDFRLYNNMRSFPLTLLVLGMDEDCYQPQDILVDFLRFWYYFGIPEFISFSKRQIPFDAKRVVLQTFRYITITPTVKNMLKLNFINTALNCSEVTNAVNAPLKVPTLVELSRNAAREAVRSAHVISTPRQFQDVVKKLDAPQAVKDIITFKRPLYPSLC